MMNLFLKVGAALSILSAGGVPALAQAQAKDLAAGAAAATTIVTVKTTPTKVAFTNHNQSGSQMSPLPDTGNLAMLITGICLAGVAASRRKVAA